MYNHHLCPVPKYFYYYLEGAFMPIKWSFPFIPLPKRVAMTSLHSACGFICSGYFM